MKGRCRRRLPALARVSELVNLGAAVAGEGLHLVGLRVVSAAGVVGELLNLPAGGLGDPAGCGLAWCGLGIEGRQSAGADLVQACGNFPGLGYRYVSRGACSSAGIQTRWAGRSVPLRASVAIARGLWGRFRPG